MSFQSAPEDVQAICCPDFNGELIPPFWSQDSKPCFCWWELGSPSQCWCSESFGWCRAECTCWGVQFNHVLDVGRARSIRSMVRKYHCLEVDSSSYWKPVKGAEERRGVGHFWKVEDQTSCCIRHSEPSDPRHLTPRLLQLPPGWSTCMCHPTSAAHPECSSSSGLQPSYIFPHHAAPPLPSLASSNC